MAPLVLGDRAALLEEAGMPERTLTKRVRTKEKAESTQVRPPKELVDDIDIVLDEIDAVLEENASEFISNYRQKGGQ
jgi:ubiquitin-like protein Pup